MPNGATMKDENRETKLNAAFVKLADTLVADFDVVDLLQWLVEECTQILDTQAGGLLLADPAGELQLVASTSEEARLIEVLQLGAGVGPCLDSFRSGRAVTIGDIQACAGQWPRFAEEALREGFHSVHATPMRLRGQTIGTMNLFSNYVGALTPADISVAQALADVATISILQERNIRAATTIAEQLQHALDSRIMIEQAKGVLAASAGLSMIDAFATMRTFARNTNTTLRAVAEGIIARSIDVQQLSHWHVS